MLAEDQLEYVVKPEAVLDSTLVRRLVQSLGRENFRAEEWRPEQTDLDAVQVGLDTYLIRIGFHQTAPDHRGFKTLYLGKEVISGGLIFRWARVDAPGLEKKAFLVDPGQAKAAVDLVEHLRSITERPSR